MRYCAYQDRATSELKRKMYEWGADPKQSEEVVKEMQYEHFIDDERYARSYVSGKHRSNKWGRLMIRQGLIQKQIDQNLIDESLGTLDYQEYIATLRALLSKKANSLKNDLSYYEKKGKLIRYAASKGYEQDLIMKLSDEIISAENE